MAINAILVLVIVINIDTMDTSLLKNIIMMMMMKRSLPFYRDHNYIIILKHSTFIFFKSHLPLKALRLFLGQNLVVVLP